VRRPEIATKVAVERTQSAPKHETLLVGLGLLVIYLVVLAIVVAAR
jgi:hypothetical protein